MPLQVLLQISGITLLKSLPGASASPSPTGEALKPPPRNGRNLKTIGLRKLSEIFQCFGEIIEQGGSIIL